MILFWTIIITLLCRLQSYWGL